MTVTPAKKPLQFYKPTGGRRTIGRAAGCATVLGAGGCLLAFSRDADFVVVLTLAFIAMLGLTHLTYAYHPALTQKTARKIDYYYLGFAAVGMLLFALVYTAQRELAVQRVQTLLYHGQEAEKLAELNTYIEPHVRQSCELNDREKCDAAKTFQSRLIAGMSSTTATALSKEMFTFTVAQLIKDRPVEGRQRYRDSGAYWSYLAFSVSLDAYARWLEENTKPTKTRHNDPAFEAIASLGQMVLWPFLLAWALALRIAKVTIDVYGWAQPDAPAAGDPAAKPNEPIAGAIAHSSSKVEQ